MARLLDPTDFGLVAMVTVFTGLAVTLVDGGLSMATIQRKEITHDQVSNLFWINAFAGALLCALSILASPFIAKIYNEPQLTAIMAVLSTTFVLSGLTVQHDALLRRQMRFKALAVVDIASVALGILAGISSAAYGLAYWSLVVMSVTSAVVQLVLRWCMLSWRPSFLNRGSGVRPLLAFGLNLTGANFVGYFVSNATPFFVGYIGGAQPLGYFNRAQTLTSIPSSQIMPPVIKVLQPTLSRVADDPIKLRRAIIGIIRKIALLTMFLTTAMVVMADWIVAVLLGSSWNEAIPIFRFLSLFTVVTPITTFTAVTLIAMGQARAFFHWRCITLLILGIALFIGQYWGVPGVIAAFALSGFFIRMPLFLFYASRYLPVSLSDYIAALTPIFCVAIVTMLVLFGLRQFIEVSNAFVALILFSGIQCLVYLGLCLLWTSLRAELSETRVLFSLAWKRR
jgi:PST family polysaccharide transporter